MQNLFSGQFTVAGDGDSVSDVGADHGDVVTHSLRCLAADDTRLVFGNPAGDILDDAPHVLRQGYERHRDCPVCRDYVPPCIEIRIGDVKLPDRNPYR